MSKTEKTLGDVIQEALKKAAAMPETAQKEQDCGCMNCSGNIVRTRTIETGALTISLSEGTRKDGEDELRFGLTDSDGTEHGLVVSGDEATAEFLGAMEELFT